MYWFLGFMGLIFLVGVILSIFPINKPKGKACSTCVHSILQGDKASYLPGELHYCCTAPPIKTKFDIADGITPDYPYCCGINGGDCSKYVDMYKRKEKTNAR